MKKFHKLIIGITLVLFTGQSFASVVISCNVPVLSVNGSHLHGDDVQPGAPGATTTLSPADHQLMISGIEKEESLLKVSYQSDCESSQHNCKCTSGICSVFFLPVNNGYILLANAELLTDDPHFLILHIPSLIFRPPLSA